MNKRDQIAALMGPLMPPHADAPQGRTIPTKGTRKDARGLLDYYLGPTGVPQRLAAANQMLNPVEGIGQSMRASQRAMAPETSPWGRFAAVGDMLSGIAGVAAPMAAAGRVGAPAADAVVDALTGVSAAGKQAAGEFAMDESGALRLFHGSPHDFDKFSMDKIGTGEGAQAYGHGLYFAEAEDTAKAYRDALQFPRIDGASTPIEKVADDLNYHRGNVDAVRSSYEGMLARGTPEAQEMAREKLAALPDAVERFKGRMYEVEVNANPDDFLDWDAPLSAQPQKVQDFANGRWNQIFGRGPDASIEGEFIAKAASPQSDIDGRAWLETSPAADQAKRLREAGIPGIRYLDQGSREAGGTRNYVVFDENLISIVRKYGIAGAAAMLGMSQAEVAQAMQQGQQ